MATQAQQAPSLLRNALRANAVFSGISGLTMTVGAAQIANLMGTGNTLFYVIIGIGLLIFAADLFYFTRHPKISATFAWLAIIGDMIWVIASAIILLTDAFNVSVTGQWLLFIVGDIVLIFAIAQYIGLRKLQ